MRKCPNWSQPGDSVNGFWKQQLLQHLGSHFQLDTFVETGTCEGATCQFLNESFKLIFTMELSSHYHLESQRRLAPYQNITLFHGDSREILPKILDILAGRPALFWLDAHSSGGATADAGDPLPEELLQIMQKSPNALIVIDDMLSAELRHVEESGVSFEGWTRVYLTGEIIMYRTGAYELPKFQEAV